MRLAFNTMFNRVYFDNVKSTMPCHVSKEAGIPSDIIEDEIITKAKGWISTRSNAKYQKVDKCESKLENNALRKGLAAKEEHSIEQRKNKNRDTSSTLCASHQGLYWASSIS